MILINEDHRIEIEDKLYNVDDVYLSIKFPIFWDEHIKECEDCNSFFKKLSNETSDDWYAFLNNKYYKLEFLDNQFIGNGNNVIMSSEIDLMKSDISCINYNNHYEIENIKLLEISTDEYRKIIRNEKINCILSEVNENHIQLDKYKSSPFVQIPNEMVEKIINNCHIIEISPDEILSFNYKIEIKKND